MFFGGVFGGADWDLGFWGSPIYSMSSSWLLAWVPVKLTGELQSQESIGQLHSSYAPHLGGLCCEIQAPRCTFRAPMEEHHGLRLRNVPSYQELYLLGFRGHSDARAQAPSLSSGSASIRLVEHPSLPT